MDAEDHERVGRAKLFGRPCVIALLSTDAGKFGFLIAVAITGGSSSLFREVTAIGFNASKE